MNIFKLVVLFLIYGFIHAYADGVIVSKHFIHKPIPHFLSFSSTNEPQREYECYTITKYDTGSIVESQHERILVPWHVYHNKANVTHYLFVHFN